MVKVMDFETESTGFNRKIEKVFKNLVFDNIDR